MSRTIRPTSLTVREEERSRGQISFSRGSVGRPLLLSKAIKASRIRVYHIREGLNKESNAHEMHGLRGIRRKKKENLRYSFMTTHLIIKASSRRDASLGSTGSRKEMVELKKDFCLKNYSLIEKACLLFIDLVIKFL